jgi:Flp pilus assembly protein TadB
VRGQVSTVALTFATAAMLAAGVLSLATGLSTNSWSVVLLAATNLTAWSVYSRMIDATAEVRVHLRYLDWMVRLAAAGHARAASHARWPRRSRFRSWH